MMFIFLSIVQEGGVFWHILEPQCYILSRQAPPHVILFIIIVCCGARCTSLQSYSVVAVTIHKPIRTWTEDLLIPSIATLPLSYWPSCSSIFLVVWNDLQNPPSSHIPFWEHLAWLWFHIKTHRLARIQI